MTNLDALVKLVRQAPDEVFIQPHNVPDPDAIASCFGLMELLRNMEVDAAIVYEHEIEKANSTKMINLFEIEMRHATDIETLGKEDWTILVDSQKGNSNLVDLVTDEVAVIDHHEYTGNKGYRFEDIRPNLGACSTIIASYYKENEIGISRLAATALLYGIFMDTANLTRGVSALDVEMFYNLYPTADMSLIRELQGNQISKADLGNYADAFKQVEVYGEIGFLCLHGCNDSLLGAASDIIVTIAGVNVVVAYSIRDTGIKLSTRSIRKEVKANDLVRYILAGVGFGGGHENMAGGIIPQTHVMADKSIDTFVRHRAISFLESLSDDAIAE